MIWHDTLAVPSFQVFYLHVQDDWVGHILDNIRAWLQQAAVAVHYVSSTSAHQSRFALLDVWAAFSLSSKNQTCSLSDAGFSIRDNSIIPRKGYHRLSKFSKMLKIGRDLHLQAVQQRPSRYWALESCTFFSSQRANRYMWCRKLSFSRMRLFSHFQ